MLKRYLTLWVSVIVGATVLLAGCGSASSTSSSSATSSATPSGASTTAPGGGKGLVIYGNAPSAQFQPVAGAFAKADPSIQLSYENIDDNVAFAKYRAEHAQGARTADIIIASDPVAWDNNRDIALPWTPTGLAEYPGFIRQFPGVFVLSPDPAVSIYSKAKFSSGQVPTTFAQLASDLKQQPGLKGKFATYTVDNPFGYSAFWGYVQEKGWSLLDTLGPASKPQSDGTALAQQLATGASVFGYFESGLVRPALTGAIGKLVGWEYMRDFTPLIPRGIAITKGAANPSGAKVFVNWLYSAAGQQVLCAAGFTAFRRGVSCPGSLAAVEQAVGPSNVYLVPFHGTIASDQSAFAARWHKLFG